MTLDKEWMTLPDGTKVPRPHFDVTIGGEETASISPDTEQTNYVHVHQKCDKCDGCIMECEHRVKATMTSSTDYIRPKPVVTDKAVYDKLMKAGTTGSPLSPTENTEELENIRKAREALLANMPASIAKGAEIVLDKLLAQSNHQAVQAFGEKVKQAIKDEIKATKENIAYHRDKTKNERLQRDWENVLFGEKLALKATVSAITSLMKGEK